jgi:topoisomerase IV subunit B
MTTKDLRFFDRPDVVSLPDGHPRRGISVVGALSQWLVHTSRRRDGAWVQRYERGMPATGLMPASGDGATGTTVHFLPDAALLSRTQVTVSELRLAAEALDPPLTLRITDQRR